MEIDLKLEKTWTESTYKEKQTLWRLIRQYVSKGNMSILATELNIPYTRREIDYYTPSTWPTPWELLDMKTLCRSCIGLLIFHTLTISTNVVPEVILVEDPSDRFLIIKLNDQIFNLIPGKIACTDDLKYVKIIEYFDINEVKRYK